LVTVRVTLRAINCPEDRRCPCGLFVPKIVPTMAPFDHRRRAVAFQKRYQRFALAEFHDDSGRIERRIRTEGLGRRRHRFLIARGKDAQRVLPFCRCPWCPRQDRADGEGKGKREKFLLHAFADKDRAVMIGIRG
jgi:hypothetical protein